MRLFVAIAPPPAVLDELESRVAPLRPAWPVLRWTGQEAWHVTLAFLGEVSEDTAAALGPRMSMITGGLISVVATAVIGVMLARSQGVRAREYLRPARLARMVA